MHIVVTPRVTDIVSLSSFNNIYNFIFSFPKVPEVLKNGHF